MSAETSVEKITENTPAKKTKRATKTSGASKTAYTAKDIDINQYITVRNGFPGRLIYRSVRTGETYTWEEIGSEQDMELKELRNARNTSRKFFENNWFVFDEEFDWVIDYLGVRDFYSNIINSEGVDGLLKKSPTEIAEEIKPLTKGQKRTVAYRAMEMIRDKEIDSISVIEVLEKGLGINLIER